MALLMTCSPAHGGCPTEVLESSVGSPRGGGKRGGGRQGNGIGNYNLRKYFSVSTLIV